MANKQIIDFNEKTEPAAEDHVLLQDNLTGVYLHSSRGNLVRRKACLHFTIGNGVAVPGIGVIGFLYLPKDCRVNVLGWRMASVAGTSGSIQVDLWHDQNRISTSNADTICGSGNEPKLVGQSENSLSDLNGWTKTLLDGGCLVAYLDSVSGFTQVILAVDVEITPLV